jgi:DNA-directed RNA polymerase specialized sigma24 family protein
VERFPLTHQSVLERIRSDDRQVRHGAFGDLVAGYWRPSYHYLRLHWRLSPDEAEDIVQGFFTVAFEKGYLEKFDPAKARFRTFLRTCLDRFLQNQRKAETALKRGGDTETLSLDLPRRDGPRPVRQGRS